jgi:hypothetical protein
VEEKTRSYGYGRHSHDYLGSQVEDMALLLGWHVPLTSEKAPYRYQTSIFMRRQAEIFFVINEY